MLILNVLEFSGRAIFGDGFTFLKDFGVLRPEPKSSQVESKLSPRATGVFRPGDFWSEPESKLSPRATGVLRPGDFWSPEFLGRAIFGDIVFLEFSGRAIFGDSSTFLKDFGVLRPDGVEF